MGDRREQHQAFRLAPGSKRVNTREILRLFNRNGICHFLKGRTGRHCLELLQWEPRKQQSILVPWW